MAVLTTREFCPNHPDLLATHSCDNCGSIVCDKCAVEAVSSLDRYCSDDCWNEAQSDVYRHFVDNLTSPYASGFKLWADSLRPLLVAVLPVCLMVAAIPIFGARFNLAQDGTIPVGFTVAFFFFGVYGFLVTASVITQQYTNYAQGSVFVWAIQRLIPWAMTWALVGIVVGIGYVFFVIPGVYLALRLFWADEYALAHGDPPWRAMKESWLLTDGEVGEVFKFQLIAWLLGSAVFLSGWGVFFVLATVLPFLGNWTVRFAPFFIGLIFYVCYGLVHSMQLVEFYGLRACHMKGEVPDRVVKLRLGSAKQAS